MSYTPDNQRFEPAVAVLREGIQQVRDVAIARLADSTDMWADSHLKELVALISELTELDLRMRKL